MGNRERVATSGDATATIETLTELLEQAAARYGDRPAVALAGGLRAESWTYRQLLAAARAVAEQLGREYQIGRGDRVLVWAPNGPQLVAVYFGCMLAGAILVPLDPFSTPDFIARVAAKTRAAAMVTGAGQVPALSCRVIRLDELRFALPAGREAPARVAPGAAERPGPEDVVEVVFTSGTTGEPKGVVLSHRNVVANVQSVRGVIPEGPPYRLLSLLPLSHMLEQTCGLYLPLLYGATIVYLPSRQPGAVFKALRRWRIMAMVVVPVLLEVMLRGIEREVRRRGQWPAWERLQRIAPYLPMAGRRLLFSGVHRQLGGCLDFFMCGGAQLSPPLAVAWERLGVKVAQGYGTTECAPVVASHTLARRAFDSVGRPVRGVQVRLSEAGEVLVKGPNVTARYWEDEAATRGAFTADGWYRTGDLAELDADGQLRLKGRLKDTIVLPSGLNVYPEDVERELAREAEVAGCVVLGLPDASGVLGVHAVVLPADRSGTPEAVRGRAEAALRRANARLAPHQQAKSCSIWPHDDFPRTSSMKVKRHEVRAILEREGRGTADVAPRPAQPRAVAAEDRRSRLWRILAEVGERPLRTIGPETDLTLDLHLDSLSRVELAVRVEEELGVAIDEGQLVALTSAGQLLALLERGEGGAQAVRLPRWALWPVVSWVRGWVQRLIVFPAHGLVCRPFVVHGGEGLARLSGPCLLVANHTSHLDTPSVLRALPPRRRRKVAVAAAADYFYRDARLGFLASLLLNTFPFSREGAVRASLDYCGELLDAGWSVLIYPEGTRSPTGALQPFKSGIGLLAKEVRAPVVPIAIEGATAVLPKGALRPRPGPLRVRIGAPIAVPAGADYAATAALLQDAVARLLPRPEG